MFRCSWTLTGCSGFSSPVGLRFPSVTALRHAAGDEGAVRRNPAQEMEHHLQVPRDEPAFAVCIAAERGWESGAACVFKRCLSLPVAENMLPSACSTDLRLSSHKVIRAHQVCETAAHTLAHQRWFVGNFLVLV